LGLDEEKAVAEARAVALLIGDVFLERHRLKDFVHVGGAFDA
jgi:hypothetical protein